MQKDCLSEKSINDKLQTQYFARTLKLLETVDSTQQYIKQQDTASLPEGYTVVADEQTDGRGRLGRKFYSPAREGIYLSILLRPKISLADIQFLTICAAVAVCRAIESVCDIEVDIKWVNDIYYRGAKLCGIITEASISAELQEADYVTLGIGVNTGEVAPEVRDIASSIHEISNIRGIRNVLIAEILNRFERVYFDFTLHGKKKDILDAYIEKMFLIGRCVEVTAPTGKYEAKVIGLSDAGALLIQTTDGEILNINTGEISVKEKEKCRKRNC